MASIQFTPQLKRFLSAPACEAPGETLGAALEHALQQNPRLRSYLLDDQDRLRKHVAVFVDGALVKGDDPLLHALEAHSEVYVMQALSGG